MELRSEVTHCSENRCQSVFKQEKQIRTKSVTGESTSTSLTHTLEGVRGSGGQSARTVKAAHCWIAGDSRGSSGPPIDGKMLHGLLFGPSTSKILDPLDLNRWRSASELCCKGSARPSLAFSLMLPAEGLDPEHTWSHGSAENT